MIIPTPKDNTIINQIYKNSELFITSLSNSKKSEPSYLGKIYSKIMYMNKTTINEKRGIFQQIFYLLGYEAYKENRIKIKIKQVDINNTVIAYPLKTNQLSTTV
ncbi:hypothetical protein TTHERM_000575469 (macronuclear) [Tetrahymena thermophila SB210]|uniref:Uncharacterized protein n=1 Tax=Tetrahymena thermophila (strain SB210) TaxID=312017 RepID=W7XDT0_TETTS|nr:hypothetical protein TTHERM_000575469 [Tetrahymena thermophila SB210]EWS75747.1 hypothetical protein TTHERM_000575469 [Tetrahymena thermophila SB210]|eukprot:XP_012651669.1 hypothetical protein TTHERM_000575469 [Tetrahymena thermophila SB210]